MNILNYMIWSPNPDIFVIPELDHPVRWYGLLFALGFIFSQQVMIWIFKQEGKPETHVEKLTVYMVVAVIAGARLGHCLFYDPTHYLSNPIEILKIWEGGLASHGGAIGIVTALYLFARKFGYKYLWILDRIVIVVVLTGALIRVGNFFNSEMEGTATNSDLGVVYAGYTKNYISSDKDVESVTFERNPDVSAESGKAPLVAVIEYKKGVKFDFSKQQTIEGRLASGLNSISEITQHIDFGGFPINYRTYEKAGSTYVEIYGVGINRHAAQLYETAYCVVLMLVLFWLWYKKRDSLPMGFNFALLMIVLWAARFTDEFFKMNQVDFEADMSLNMGQWLSIPLTIIGVILMVRICTKKDQPRMSDS